MPSFQEKYGPWAVITGASRGLGEAFAEEFARLGFNLILSARSADKLEELSKRLREKYKKDIRPIPLDLSHPSAPETLFKACDGLDVGLLVNNAGIFPKNYFEDMPLEELLATVRLNCMSGLELTHRFLPRFRSRKRSGIIFVSSIQAFQSVPYMSNYSATKAYDFLLAQGLWYELKPLGIDVLSLNPGFINKPGKNAGIGATDPEPIVRDAVKFLGRRMFVVTGLVNKIFANLLGRFLPVPVSLRVKAGAAVIKKSMRRRKKQA